MVWMSLILILVKSMDDEGWLVWVFHLGLPPDKLEEDSFSPVLSPTKSPW